MRGGGLEGRGRQAVSRIKPLMLMLALTALTLTHTAPFINPDLVWDFRLPLVKSINASGHKFGYVVGEGGKEGRGSVMSERPHLSALSPSCIRQARVCRRGLAVLPGETGPAAGAHFYRRLPRRVSVLHVRDGK